MKFPPIEDIPGIETQSFNINKVDKEMHELIRDVRFAITHDYDLRRRSRELTSALDDLLNQHAYTHQSMRYILRQAYRKQAYQLVADTASLAREQVEKIYQAVILCQGPHKWIRQYLKSGWQKDYEEYLLEMDEYGQIDRYREHLSKEYPVYLENLRNLTLKRNDPPLVSDFAKRVVEYNWHNRSGVKSPPKPKWFKRSGSITGFLTGYFYFPTPWAVMGKVRNKKLFVFLDRWYREYKTLSEYSHVLTGKVVAQRVMRDKSVRAAEKAQIYGEKKAETFILISNIAAASLCTVIMPYLGHHYGSKNTTKEYWEQLYSVSLLAKALWKLYPEKILH